ncbi:MAG: N-acetyltransferase [Anaerolineae bacterium]|nr:N-acetyltransferase [Anaerolineae bacterium]
MSSPIVVSECRTPQERRQFIEFQWEIYKDDPYWVPPLVSERVAFYDKARNPFFEHSDAAMFVARRDGRIAGTIVAIQNNRHNEFHGEKTGFFGGFEVINDFEVAAALFDAARDWVKVRGMSVLRGPATLSLNDECGLLVDGFDSEPMVLMPYNPPYYATLVERYGFRKAMDLWAWWVSAETAQRVIGEKLERLTRLVEKRGRFTVRTANFKRLKEEVEALKAVYASESGAWRENWGHVPMTAHELEHAVNNLKQFADPDFILIVESQGKPIGIGVALPNVNRPLRKAYPNPKTPEWWTLLKFLYYRRTMVNSVRVILAGVLKEHRASGIEAVIMLKLLQTGVAKGYVGGEMSWILETNDAMNRIIAQAGATVYKTYRLYDLPILG